MTPAIDLDTRLMIRVQQDDISGFGELLSRNRPTVVNYLSRMVGNRAIAEELAQDVFVRVYRSRGSYLPSAKFSTWLYRIMTNVALNHFRDAKRVRREISLDIPDAIRIRREAFDGALSIEQRLVREVAGRRIRCAIRSLPPKQRAAVIMHKYDEMDYARIAAVFGCSSAAVKALMFRAYETLRLRLRGMQTP